MFVMRKIGSGDITWHEIIDKMCQYDLPIFLASGASNLDEVKMAVKLIKKSTKNLCLMQCNTNYTGSLNNFNISN